MKPLQPIILDINYMPELNYPFVQAFIDPDVELSESHIQCIYEAIRYAESVGFGEVE